MTERLHLILHKVRGKPAWDVAFEMDIGSERGWIIPTSGHRAYPLTSWQLDNIITLPPGWYMESLESHVASDPRFAGLPDHYSVNDRKERTVARAPGVDDIFAALSSIPGTAGG